MKLYGVIYSGANNDWAWSSRGPVTDRTVAEAEAKEGNETYKALTHMVVEFDIPDKVETPEQTEARLGAF